MNSAGADSVLNFSSGGDIPETITCKFNVGGDSSGSYRYNQFYINDTKVYQSSGYYSSNQPVKTYFTITVDLKTMTTIWFIFKTILLYNSSLFLFFH